MPGGDETMAARADNRPSILGVASLDNVSFWIPLPGASDLPDAAQRLVRVAEADIHSRRFESALDATLAVNANAPDFLPGFIRAAELLIATRRRDRAKTLIESIERHEQVFDRDEFELAISRVKVHLGTETDHAYALAHRLLGASTRQAIFPYVPAAVEQLIADQRFEDAAELADTWVSHEPASRLALMYRVRANLLNGKSQEAFKTIRRFRDEYEADRIWPENIVVSALVAVASDQSDPKWVAAGPVCQGIRDGTVDYDQVTEILEFLVPSVSVQSRALIFAGLLAMNAGDKEEAQAIFQTTPAESSVDVFLRSVGLERTEPSTGDQRNRFRTLRDIWKSLSEPGVAELAANSGIFDPPASRTKVGVEIARILSDNESFPEALRLLTELIKAGTNDAEVFRLQAEIMGRSGSQDDALEAFQFLADHQEQQRKYADAIETLESMIELAPENMKLRSRIVDNCLKIGRFEMAIDHLITQGKLFHNAGRLPEAEVPIYRAIEIATMVNDWQQVDRLHRLLISFAPEETRLRHSAVTTYVQHGRTSEALEQLKEIVDIASKQKEFDEAIAASHQMLALAPEEPAAYHQLGELLISIQEYSQAERVYRRLANLLPDDKAVRAKRSAIAALIKARNSSS
jgi:tetratricopeptide (TPR) repeat protein